MPKLQYNSGNESEDEKNEQVIEPITINPTDKRSFNEPVIKPKRQQSEAQKQNTMKMRDALKTKRENDLRIKEQVRLENEMMKQQIKKKTMKEKVNEKVMTKLKQIAESETDSESDEEEQIIVKKVKAKKVSTIKPVVKQVIPPVQQQQQISTPIIRFF